MPATTSRNPKQQVHCDQKRSKSWPYQQQIHFSVIQDAKKDPKNVASIPGTCPGK